MGKNLSGNLSSKYSAIKRADKSAAKLTES